MRKIAVVTTARSDYNSYLPVLYLLRDDPELQYQVIVSGMHLEDRFGYTVRMIESDGFEIDSRIPLRMEESSRLTQVSSGATAMLGYGKAFDSLRPDIVLLEGDRYEMHAAAIAALALNIPIAHMGGGDITEGAIDESLRHSLTKLSHLHFVASETQAQLIRQMGEEAWRIFVTGEPTLDNIKRVRLLSAGEMRIRYDFPFDECFLLVTFHPVTLEVTDSRKQVRELLAALRSSEMPVLLTKPNSDAGSDEIIEELRQFAGAEQHVRLVSSLDTQEYFSAMELAAAMIGNSSSGLIEAASFKLPVVNVGTRQSGRICGNNVITVPCEVSAIAVGIAKAVSPEFKAVCREARNPYGDGNAAGRIVSALKSVSLGDKLLRKKFVVIQK